MVRSDARRPDAGTALLASLTASAKDSLRSSFEPYLASLGRTPFASRLSLRSSLASLASLVPTVGGTDVELRNYDDHRSYEFTLWVRDDDAVAFEREYRLDPGESRRERGVLDAGTYDIVVDGPDVDRDTAACRVGNGSARTVHVEAGNSVLSVSGGVS